MNAGTLGRAVGAGDHLDQGGAQRVPDRIQRALRRHHVNGNAAGTGKRLRTAVAV
jgi:hypothetical protein